MSAKITMEYAQNMISNLRAQFKEAHKVEFNGTDQQVLDILNSDIVAPTAAEQDEWYVDYMWSVHSNNLIKGV